MINITENIIVIDDAIPIFLQDLYESMIFGKTNNEQLYPTVDFTVKYETTAAENGIVPLSFNHILKSSARLSPHLENFSLIPIKVCEYANKFMHDILFASISNSTIHFDTRSCSSSY